MSKMKKNGKAVVSIQLVNRHDKYKNTGNTVFSIQLVYRHDKQ